MQNVSMMESRVVTVCDRMRSAMARGEAVRLGAVSGAFFRAVVRQLKVAPEATTPPRPSDPSTKRDADRASITDLAGVGEAGYVD